MGKGQRAREARAQQKIDNPQKYAAKTKKKSTEKKWITPLVTTIVVVLIVGIFALTYLNDNGIILRNRTVMETENFKVTGTMMQYATMSTYQNFVNQYGDLISYMGLDTSKSLASQKYGDGTWLDYFKESATLSMEGVLVYAEAAKEAGITLDEDELKKIDDSIASIKTMAAINGTTEDSYLAMLYGKGVNKKDIREFYELTTLANKYETQVYDETEAAITDEDLDAYYKENIDTYAAADVLTYTDTLKLDESLSDEEKAAKKAEFLAKFDAMGAAASEEEFKEALLAYLTEKATEDDSKTPEELVEAALETLSKSDIALKDAAEWVFELTEDSAHVRVAGDVKVFVDDDEAPEETEEEETEENTEDTADKAEDTTADTSAETEGEPVAQSEDDTADTASADEIDASELTGDSDEAEKTKEVEYSVEVYYIVKAPYADETTTKDAGHILFSLDAYGTEDAAKTAAEKVYSEYLAGDKTKDSFETLAEANTDDSGVFYDNIKPGDMVPEFEEWVYDEDRAEGDTGLVLTDYGYHLMYFVGDGDPVWIAECKTALTGERAGEIYDGFVEKYSVTTNNSALKAVKG